MSYRHWDFAFDLESGTPGAKAVLLVFARRACDDCGLAWPGYKYVMAKSRLKETTVRAAIGELKAVHLIVPHGYETGGRGRATEFIVLPGLVECAAHAPCQGCRSRMKTHRLARGMTNPGHQNPSAGEGYSHKPIGKPPLNPSAGGPHEVIEEIISGSGPEPFQGPGSASPRPSEPTEPPNPEVAANALRDVDRMVRESRTKRRAESPSHAKDGALEANSEGGAARKMPGPETEVVGNGEAKAPDRESSEGD